MESYFIRIYRRDEENPDMIVGLIEEIGTEVKRSFKNLSELTAIIATPAGKIKTTDDDPD